MVNGKWQTVLNRQSSMVNHKTQIAEIRRKKLFAIHDLRFTIDDF
ncbi:MAG: hypothetical protein ACR2GD_12965 [Pyrinomonadaceae bacterium]